MKNQPQEGIAITTALRYVMMFFIGLYILNDLSFWLLVAITLAGGYYMLRQIAAAFHQAAILFLYSLMMVAFLAASVVAFPHVYRVYSAM